MQAVSTSLKPANVMHKVDCSTCEKFNRKKPVMVEGTRKHEAVNYLRHKLGTCEASRFEFESAVRLDSIRDWLIRKFSNQIGRACSFAHRKLSQTTQTINGT